MDNSIDGKFVINKDEGITQGIAKELQLSKEECKKLGSIWNQIINEFDNPENMVISNNNNVIANKSNNYLVHKGAIVEFSKNTWNKIVNIINSALNKNFKTLDNDEIQQPTTNNIPSEIAETLSNDNFKNTIEQTIPKQYQSTLLEYLNPENGYIITADENNLGAARYDNDSNKIIINNKSPNKSNKDDLIKILVHEGMHAAQKSSFNTQEEELLCEMSAIRTTATLVENGEANDNIIYGKKYSELNSMSDQELKEYLKLHFINDQTEGHFGVGAYSNRIIDKSGAITIHDATGKQIPLQAGSKISIGNKQYTLGNDVYIEGIGGFAGSTCQIFKLINGKPQTIGIITFDNMTQLPMEQSVPPIKQHNDSINANQFQVGTISNSDNENFTFKITNYNESL